MTIENPDPSKIRTPFYINYSDLSTGKNEIIKAIANFIIEIRSEFSPDNYLEAGSCLIMFDDFILLEGKRLDNLKKFISTYPDNLYIFVHCCPGKFPEIPITP